MLGWWKTLGGGEWEKAKLSIITASENGCIIGIAPLFLTKSDIEENENTLLLLGSFEISDYLDLIVAEKNLEQFISGLFGFLMDNLQLSWERLDLFNVPEHSTSIAHIKKYC